MTQVIPANISGIGLLCKKTTMYEHKKQALLPKKVYYRRLANNFFIAIVVMLLSLIIGIAGYHWFGGMGWMDAIHNASMILSGMGLVNPVSTESGKAFSSFYALFSGVIFITNFGIILAPAVHRIMHRLHLEDKA